ncbi:damage-inducible protein DinB [Rhodobacteraceae bacterium CCMM004]|nr:damage-inducible protein DinB [Rhodobacteraceae bacterium CCMM004]
MIGGDYVRVMARYNTWQNASLLTAADTLDDDALEQNRGAYFGSIRCTMSHLLWGDAVWLARFTGSAAPTIGIPDSVDFAPDYDGLAPRRRETDARIEAWAAGVSDADLEGQLSWHSAALGREVAVPLSACVVHFFNHQTHHRGQIHAMLTAAGAVPDDTDLVFMPGLA